MYFARMKRENRSGPKLLGNLPEPDKFSADNLAGIITENNAAIVDTRAWEEYKTGHIHGSIFAPLNNSFSTVTGSYITHDMSIYLIIDEKQLKEAVNGLIRIGLDNVPGFITPDDLLVYQKNYGELIESEEVNTSELKTKLDDEDVFLLDVRGASELDEIGYIKGAYNIAHTRLHYRFNEIPRDKIVMVQCRTGSRSKYAFSFLEKKGFKVDHVSGGILEWINAGNKVERTDKIS
jgi:hydroxyacylglutathione hydrolase